MVELQKKLAFMSMLIFVMGAIFFLGKFRYHSNAISRLVYKNLYLSEVVKSNKIDAEKFWEFRDFYSATTSSFKPENIPDQKPFLIISSGSAQSLDFLLPANSKTVKKFSVPNGSNLIFKSQNELVYKDDENIVVRFVKEIPEMENANGFFRNFGVSLKPYEGYLWYNETVIKP